MTAPCDAMQAELALELVEGELAAELPAHLRAFARAHALLRLVAPIAIEDDPAVARARAEPPSWPGLAALAAARDAVAQRRFGCGAIEWLHRLHGVEGAG